MSTLTTLRKNFNHTPTPDQDKLFILLERFLADKHPRCAFVLKGYAGTGKTSAVIALTNSMEKLSLSVVLLAPTGRAAKVLKSYTNLKTSTIHRHIYEPKLNTNTGDYRFQTQKNQSTDTLYIVDESSMIAGSAEFGGRNILKDLIDYIFSGAGNKLLLIGDTAQLPPVQQELSPALDVNLLGDVYDLKIYETELKTVVRQANDSGILHNATTIRNVISGYNPAKIPTLRTSGFPDIFRMSGARIADGLDYAYKKYGRENVVVITRSNKRANGYNKNIRNHVFYLEDEITTGDLVMVVKNNYFWLEPEHEAGFIANGDIAEILKIRNEEEKYGFRFATAKLRLVDYPDAEPFETKINLDSLRTETPSLSMEQVTKLMNQIMLEHNGPNPATKNNSRKVLDDDPYFNALQIKFAYSITCHKAQGGQWKLVFIDPGYLADDRFDKGLNRWFYTAVTRAIHELYLVNFPDVFFMQKNPVEAGEMG